MDCIFCQIAKKKQKANIVYEDDRIIAFENIKPLAPIHLLIIPKKHIKSVNAISKEDADLIGYLWTKIKEIAKIKNLTGYKVIANVEKEGGQEIFHLHYHLLGGWKSKKEGKISDMP